MADLNKIIERLEKATGPDRELDALIVAELHDATMRPYPPSDDFGPHDKWQFWTHDGKHFLGSEAEFPVPAYTSSVDAALTLVPDGLPWMVRRSQPWDAAHPYCAAYVQTAEHDEHSSLTKATTAARALCIAALKARSTING